MGRRTYDSPRAPLQQEGEYPQDVVQMEPPGRHGHLHKTMARKPWSISGGGWVPELNRDATIFANHGTWDPHFRNNLATFPPAHLKYLNCRAAMHIHHEIPMTSPCPRLSDTEAQGRASHCATTSLTMSFCRASCTSLESASRCMFLLIPATSPQEP